MYWVLNSPDLFFNPYGTQYVYKGQKTSREIEIKIK